MFKVNKKSPFIHSQRNVYADPYTTACNFCKYDYGPYETEMNKYIRQITPLIEYDINDTNEIDRKMGWLDWCSQCNQFSGECCVIESNGCTFSTFFTKAVVGYELYNTFIEGSPIILEKDIKNFINLIELDRLELKIWCPCPGFCPLYSSLNYDPCSGNMCCKFKNIDFKKELLEKYPNLEDKIKYSRNTTNPWPYEQ